FWFIPLSDGTTSVGAVCSPDYLKTRKTDPTEFLFATIALCPQLADRLKNAKLLGPATATGNYSYDSSRCHGDRYIAVGDAYTFIDPVFSSGVYLAMNGAFQGAEVIDAWIRDDKRAAAKALKEYERLLVRGPKVFSWFIYRISAPAFRNMFMDPSNVFRAQEAVLSVLAGDVFRYTPIGRSLLFFKTYYYLSCLRNWRMALPAAMRHKRVLKESIREASDAA
ncbi:MAG TPA: tryptophan 7-halogenase, partial [Rhodocyclaceae bacterium]|nr:tryptophan 7-halogenase [Rhodocyclaceae bacterium]